jgi:hypothetical protein
MQTLLCRGHAAAPRFEMLKYLTLLAEDDKIGQADRAGLATHSLV